MILKCRQNEASKNLMDEVKRTPAMIPCNFDCEACGFNPEVSKLRLQRGHFVENASMIRYEINRSGNSTKSWYVSGLKQLVFPKWLRAD